MLNELLQKELDEHHQYSRNNIQLLINWYTFFLTLQLGAFGWFGTEIAKEGIKQFYAIYVVAVYFIVQNILSIIGCQLAKKDILRVDQRVKLILNGDSESAMPASFYVSVLRLFQCTLVTLLIFWFVFLWIILYVPQTVESGIIFS